MSSENKVPCPIDKAVELFKKKWTIQIIRDMFFGKKQFNQFKEDKPNLSNKVLSACLKDMISNGLITKKMIDDDGTKIIEYSLTDLGQSLNKVIYELAIFTLEKCNYVEYKNEETKLELKNVFQETLNIN
ncbi:MAG: helix-turn-helix domain-containing protein [Methanobacteriaceae archaeon]|nr:helix-turn-helix domain-containing protein [Methanobacteriaceae archaeon]